MKTFPHTIAGVPIVVIPDLKVAILSPEVVAEIQRLGLGVAEERRTGTNAARQIKQVTQCEPRQSVPEAHNES